MRAILDLVDMLTSSIRAIVGMIVLAGLAIGLMLSLAGAYVAPKVADSMADRVERVGSRAIEAAEHQHQVEQMTKQGWGAQAVPVSGNREGQKAGSGWSKDAAAK